MTGGDGGGFDEISYKLGLNAKGLESLNRLFEQHCQDDDRRHGENVALMMATNTSIEALTKRLEERLAIAPDGNFLSKKQIAMLAVVGTTVLVVIGWMAEAAVKWAVAWFIGAILKIKLGG